MVTPKWKFLDRKNRLTRLTLAGRKMITREEYHMRPEIRDKAKEHTVDVSYLKRVALLASSLNRTTMLVGFELWIPPKSTVFEDGMPVYEIIGTDAQIVQFPLRAGRSVTCFSGAMAYMSEHVALSVKLAGFKKTFGRLAGGGSLFQLTYTNESVTEDGYIAMTPDYPGVIVPINMSTSGKIIALRDSFLCSTIDVSGVETDISAGFNPAQSVGGFCCSGVDFIVQTVENGEWAFLMAMGTVVTRTLAPGERILVDTDSVLCFESSVAVDIQWVGNVAAVCCGGEGLFNTTLTGPGKIWLQSFGIDKMRKLFPPKVAQTGGGDGSSGDGVGQ